MANISKIKLPSGITYDVKDTTARNDTAMNLSSIGMSKKNLLPFPQTITKSGITFTCDANGYMTSSNTSTDIRQFTVSNSQYSVKLKAGKYILSFVSSTVCTNAYGNIMVLSSDSVQIAGIGQTNYVKHTSGSVEFTLDTEQTIYVMSKIFDGVTAVMIRYSDITDDTYEPYVDDLQTQIQNNDTEIRDMLALSTKPAKTVYVDGTNGSDDNDGSTKAKAFKTLEKAIKLLLECNSLIVYLASGTYKITSDGWIGTSSHSYLRNKTLYLSNYNQSNDNVSDVIVQGIIRVLYNSTLLCTYITLESIESSSWNNTYASMFYIGECATVYFLHCDINNAHYESTFAISSSRASFNNITINNTSGKTNRHGFRVTFSTIFINNLTDDTSTADIYNKYPCFITCNRTLTERGTRGGLLVVNGEIQQ